MRRVLITGCTGFLGATLAELLIRQGVEVIGLRRPQSPSTTTTGVPIQFITGDILDQDSLVRAMHAVDVVFHVAGAANYWQLPAKHVYKINVEGTRTVLEAASKARIQRVIYTSSTAALGIPVEGKPLMDEANSFNLPPATFPYGHSKHLAEQLVLQYLQAGMDIVRVLPSAIIGPRDIKFNAGGIIRQALNPMLPFLPLPQGGLNYIDVYDCAKGHLHAALWGKSGERYILAGHNLTHQETIRLVNSTLGTTVSVVDLPAAALPALAQIARVLRLSAIGLPIDHSRVLLAGYYLYYNNQRAVSEFNLPITPFAKSVRSAYDWYLQNGYLKKNRSKIASTSNQTSKT